MAQPRMIYGEWKRRKNIDFETLYSVSDILKVIRRIRLRLARHAWKNQNTLLHAVIEQDPVGKDQ